MVMLEPLISLIVCSCLGGPGPLLLTGSTELKEAEEEERGREKERARTQSR